MKKYEKYKDSGVEWVGKIPVEWNFKKLKFIVSLVNEQINPIPNGAFTIGLENIETFTGKLISQNSSISGAANKFLKKDILFNKLRPYLAKVYLAKHEGFSVGELLVLRPHKKIAPEFLFYRLISSDFISEVNSSTYGSKMPRASWEFISNLKFGIPNIDEQDQIVQFLNNILPKIDFLISKLQVQINLLNEERAAIINQAVTKGLDTNVKMKDSGIEWLGEIPEHWELRKIGRSFNIIGSGTTPLSGSANYYENGTINWVNTGDLNDTKLFKTKKKVTQLALKDYSALKIFPQGTLIIALYGATIGKVSLLQIEACTNQACCILGKSEFFDINFVYYWFLVNKPNIVNLAYGGGQPNISQDLIKSLRIPSPKLNEQKKIVEFLDREIERSNNLTSKIQKQIELLKEYRTTLISDVVTGKIKVS